MDYSELFVQVVKVAAAAGIESFDDLPGKWWQIEINGLQIVVNGKDKLWDGLPPGCVLIRRTNEPIALIGPGHAVTIGFGEGQLMDALEEARKQLLAR